MRKKLIEFGWDIPSPAYVVEHIRDMEKRPFDGVMLKVGGDADPNATGAVTTAGMRCGRGDYSQVFRSREVDEAGFAADQEWLRRIEWGTFTDNLIVLYATSDMDWFSDEDWGGNGWVLRNVRMCARAAHAGRCKGITFDAEPYLRQGPWKYSAQPHAGSKSFAAYEAVVRERGARFVTTIQEELSDPVIHTLFLNSCFPRVAATSDDRDRAAMLSEEFYGLLVAFLNGMLDAAGSRTVITDGNEDSYYFTNTRAFLESYHLMRQTALNLVPTELRHKYRCQVQASQALYVDYLCGLRSDRLPGAVLSVEERARWIEHNVYWALTCCDGYAWLYSERMNWWTDEHVPPVIDEAIRSARRKVAACEPLGFEVDHVTSRAQCELEIAASAPITAKTACVHRFDAGAQRLPADAGRSPLEFTPFLMSIEARPEAVTRAWMAWDEDDLHIHVRCCEPDIRGLTPMTRDEEAIYHTGDRVEVLLAPRASRAAYFHLAVDPWGQRWDAVAGRGDSSWNPDYRCVAHRDRDHWSVELAVPWAAIDMPAPRPGDHVKGNLVRRRGRLREFSSWSCCRWNRGPEPENFGTWVFAS